MAFVRTKRIKGIEYHYLVEGVREAGKVRQKVLCYLGQCTSVKAAFRHWKREAQKHQDSKRKQYAAHMLKQLKPYL